MNKQQNLFNEIFGEFLDPDYDWASGTIKRKVKAPDNEQSDNGQDIFSTCERLTNIARAKYEKIVKESKVSDLTDVWKTDFRNVSKSCDYFYNLIIATSKSYFKPLIKSMDFSDLSDANLCLLKSYTDDKNFTMSFHEVKSPRHVYSKEGCDEKVIECTITDCNYDVCYSFQGLTNKAMRLLNRGYRDGVFCDDPAHVMAGIWLIRQLKQCISEYTCTEVSFEDIAKKYQGDKDEIYIDISTSIFKKYSLVVEMIQFLAVMMRDCKVPTKVVLTHCKQRDALNTVKFIRETELVSLLVEAMPYMLTKGALFSYTTFLYDYASPSFFPGFTKIKRGYYNIVHDLLSALCEKYLTDKLVRGCDSYANYQEMLKEDEQTRAAYARSYQTKHSIPSNILKKMDTTKFLETFGYVEFDSCCELDSISKLEEEWLLLYNKYFYFLDLTETSLRFRLLGNHKAIGLYYRYYNCICVDLRACHSFIHELGHCIDFQCGRLSDVYEHPEFNLVYNTYSMLLKERIAKDKITLKGKYDLKYYLNPTEVFARAFELYCYHVLGIKKSSFCNTEEDFDGFCYPKSEAFNACVKDYFNELFEKLKLEKERRAS